MRIQELTVCGMRWMLVFSILILSAFVNSVATSHKYEKCRCLASDECWPTAEEWNYFNQTVGGRLVAPKPTGYPCHDPHFNAAQCESVLRNSSNSYLRESNPGSMQFDQWEDEGNHQCTIQAPRSARCAQGRVSVLGVEAKTVEDVQKAIRFAVKQDLRLVIKSSGHDYLGRSAAANSFLLWMHKLNKNISITTSFMATQAGGNNCGTATPAVTLVGAVVWAEVYDALKDTGYTVVGGIGVSICATGGYGQGGGHGLFSPSFGLAVDNVLQIELVTADGRARVVNPCQDPDLFFALRGGGGGTFGVVTSITYKLHKTPNNLVSVAVVMSPPLPKTSWAKETQEDLLTVWYRNQVTLDRMRWGGYWVFDATSFVGNFLVPATQNVAHNTLTPILKALSKIKNVNASASLTDWHQDWHGATYKINLLQGMNYTGYRIELGGRIVPYAALIGDARGLAKTTVSTMTTSGQESVIGAMVIGPGVRDADPHSQTSVTPAWRQGAFSLISAGIWTWNGTDPHGSVARRTMLAFTELLHKMYPDSGVYINEACLDEPNWKHSFWGSNYARLLAIKLRVDPSGLFVCLKCVGSDLWNKGGNCRVEFH